MSGNGSLGLLLVIVNIIFSYKGLTDETFFDTYKFEVDKILINKEYKRLISSGFLHVGWKHLILNMFALLFFSRLIENNLGEVKFLLIYFISMIGGDLLSLFVHRNHGDYNAVGASGAICGLVFASIALFPGMIIFFVPGWLFGVLYVAYSIYGIKSKKDNIGHEAHLGGALIGMLTALLLEPSAFADNYITILLITVPTIVFIYLISTRPQILLIDNFYFKNHNNYYSIDHKYNAERNLSQQEIDAILDKISKKGMSSLSRKEKEQLKKYSKTV